MGLIQNYIEIPLGNLRKAAWNYKVDEPAKLKKLVNNIRRNGQIENVIVRETGEGIYKVVDGVETGTGVYEIVNGNHRQDAFEILGKPTAVAYNLGPNISDAVAARIAVETNETRFGTDDFLLAKVIQTILGEYEVEDLTESVPFTADEIRAYQDLVDFRFSKFGGDVDVEADPPKDDADGGVQHRHQFFALPGTAVEIMDRLHQEERQAEQASNRDEIILKKRIRVRLTSEQFDLFCTVFDMTEKNAYDPKRLIEYIQSKA